MAGCPCDLWRESRNGRTYRFFLVLLGMPCGRWKLSRTLLFLFLLFFRPFFFFFFFFSFFSPRILSSRSLPLPAIIGYSDGFNRHWMVWERIAWPLENVSFFFRSSSLLRFSTTFAMRVPRVSRFLLDFLAVVGAIVSIGFLSSIFLSMRVSK